MSVKIYIDMPKGCSRCPFCSFKEGVGFSEDYYSCVINGEFLGVNAGEKRHNSCPLKECE
jgi:hypothetical protein